MSQPGYYFGAHDGCSIYAHHRHPLFANSGKATPQPHEYLVSVPATVNITFAVDLDGTIRVHDANFAVGKDDINYKTEIQDQATYKPAELEDELYEKLLDALPRDGEIALGNDWSVRQPAPLEKDDGPSFGAGTTSDEGRS